MMLMYDGKGFYEQLPGKEKRQIDLSELPATFEAGSVICFDYPDYLMLTRQVSREQLIEQCRKSYRNPSGTFHSVDFKKLFGEMPSEPSKINLESFLKPKIKNKLIERIMEPLNKPCFNPLPSYKEPKISLNKPCFDLPSYKDRNIPETKDRNIPSYED